MSKHKKDLARRTYQRIKELAIPVRMNGPWVMLDDKAPSDLVMDMATCDANELARMVREGEQS